jgi:hypothetical protein
MPVNPGAGSAELGDGVPSITPELTAGLIGPGTGMCTSMEGSCSERIACERGSGRRQLRSARRLLDDPYGHLSRVWLSDGQSGPLCELPSRGSALTLSRSAATAGAGTQSFSERINGGPYGSPCPIHQNISGSGRLSMTSRSLHDSFPCGRADLTARPPPVSRRRGHAAISQVRGVGQLESRRTTLLLTIVGPIRVGADVGRVPRPGRRVRFKIVADKACKGNRLGDRRSSNSRGSRRLLGGGSDRRDQRCNNEDQQEDHEHHRPE